MIDLRDNVRTAEIFTVDIQEPEPQQQPKKEEEEKKEVKKSEQAKNEKAINTGGLPGKRAFDKYNYVCYN